MAEAEGNNKNKERDKKQGQNGSQIFLRDPVFGFPEPQPDGTYIVGFTALVYWGNKPAWGQILWRPRVNGKPIAGFQIVVGSRVEHGFKLSGEKVSLAIDLKYGEWERTISLRDIELPKQKRKIEVVSTLHHDDQLEVVLRRVGKDGKSEAGSIMTWDFDVKEGQSLDWRIFKWVINPGEENILIGFECRENSRRLTFLLPDDKEVKTELEIPAKKVVVQQQAKPQLKTNPFFEGRNAFRKLVGKKPLTQTTKKQEEVDEDGRI